MAEEKEYLGPSLDPDDSLAGGLFDNKTAAFKGCKFEMFDYNGTTDPAPSLSVTFAPIDEAEEYTQHYSVGNKDFWAPTDDGEWIRPVGAEKEIRKSSNLHVLMQSLREGGMPMSLLKDRKISALNGIVAHMVRKEVAGRGDLQQGQTKRRSASGKEYEKDNKVLLVERVVSLPDEAGKKDEPKKGSKKKAAEEKPTPGSSAGEDVQEKARQFILEAIMEGDGKAVKKELPNKAFTKLGNDPDKNKVLAIVFKNENILALGGFAIDDAGVITLA